MNLQSILYASIFILQHLNNILIRAEENEDLVISQTGIDSVTPCGIGLKFFVELNNTSDKHDYEVQVSADQCCLEADGSLDCDVLEMIGDCVGLVSKGAIKTVRMIAPILDPLERRGYCILYLDSKCSFNGKNKRNTVKVSFDTRIKNINKILQANIKPCRNIDEDPLNDCKPVDCDTYYNSRKSHYNKKLKRCVSTPPCLSDILTELPNSIYDPISNRCIEGKSINKRDVNYLKKINAKDRQAKDVLIIKKFHEVADDNITNSDVSDAIDKVPMCKKCNKLHILNPAMSFRNRDISIPPHVTEDYYKHFFMKYIKNNICTLSTFGGVIILQCCLIFGMAYYFTKTCTRCKDKKLVRKFFNYRQDVSVTTPLIGTSNIDTETDYQFETESSNVDKKIKCYKACQKEKNNNVKMSMSDDILSKCVNRRNWSRQQTKTEVIQEATNETRVDIQNIEVSSKQHESIKPNKPSETKVIFEDEKPKSERQSYKVGSIPKCLNKEIIEREKEEIKDYESSELEIQCHSYNNNINSNVTGFNPSSAKKMGYCQTEKTTAVSMSTAKEAQAAFSNDSIDDYLSERGIYLAENISRYSFRTDSDPTKTSSPPISSKTSKNNFVKKVLSIMNKKSTTNTSSEPGSKVTDNLDLKVLHVSRGSIYSTSNDSKCTMCRPKDSRTSIFPKSIDVRQKWLEMVNRAESKKYTVQEAFLIKLFSP